MKALIEVANATAKGKTLSVADDIPSHSLHTRDLMDNISAKQTVQQSCSVAALRQLRQAQLLPAEWPGMSGLMSAANMLLYLAESGADPFS